MKLINLVGTRPQFIKAAALSRQLKLHPTIQEIIVHTGQHFDKNMSDVFFDEMMIPNPKYNLEVNSLNHGAMTGRMIEKIEEVLLIERPDFLLVYGDTNSTLAGALAAKKLNIKVAHIEAGLRSFNMQMPEEINRILTDRISDILFCPTDTALKNLKIEGYENFDCTIVKNGDVMMDVALFYAEISSQKSKIIEQLNCNEFVLATIHRPENTDDVESLKNIISAFNTIAQKTNLVLPLHPRTKAIIEKNNIKTFFKITEPVGYFDMLELLKNCKLVITDSGGLQKEAFYFHKQCITIRKQTEWIELLQGGFCCLSEPSAESIFSAYEHMENKKSNFDVDYFGKGNASEIVVNTLLKF
jgi:UDP-GlcNAc3NAcA epimerase